MINRLTAYQYRILSLMNEPIPSEMVSKFDQRPLRGLHMRGYIKINRKLEFYRTKAGSNIMAFYNDLPKERKNINRPLAVKL